MQKFKKIIKVFPLIFLALFILIGCGSKTEATLIDTPYKDTQFMMGTYVTLQVYDEGKEAILEEGFSRVKEIAEMITNTDVVNINNTAGTKAVEVSDDIYNIVRAAHEYSAIPDSGFDYTIKPLTDLWRIGFDDARKPAQKEINAVLPLIDYERVELNDDDQSVFLTEKGMAIDLGAIAKGYMADEVRKIFEEAGVTTAIIDLGGNVVVMGGSPSSEHNTWSVGVQDPFSEKRGESIATLPTSDKSVVTSGIYERYLKVDEEVYHHLLDPETGYPFNNEFASVTIISDESMAGDALATVVYGQELDDGLEYINSLENIEAIFITKDKELYTTAGLFRTLEVTNDDYNWMNAK